MLEHEADDEHSSLENEGNILHLMDGIAIFSQSHKEKQCKVLKHSTVRNHKITRAERSLLNNHPISIFNNDKGSHKTKSLERWRGAFTKVKKLKDPWKNFDLFNIIPERVQRYYFDSFNGSWLKPVECLVYIESKPFNRGAMRECFRLKKMSSLFKESDDWSRAGNYVAKRYIELVDDSIYYEDVKLQLDAKLWGQEYSRQQGILKKVDICQMSVIKFIDRPEQPLYHLEHFIEGDYIKYNSNSGFVDENCRNTPQAFSHFTFERSGHKLIVVDIQGVGDLYTDPQIHTFAQNDYGDGNLGPRGMALFFNSHICNPICNVLGLKKFDLSPSEKVMRGQTNSRSNNLGTVALHNSARVRSIYEEKDTYYIEKILLSRLNHENINEFSTDDSGSEYPKTIIHEAEDGDDEESETIDEMKKVRCRRHSSENMVNEDSYRQYFISKCMEHRSSCVTTDLIKNKIKCGENILGEIHHELARLHSSGKFINENNKNVNWEAFMFHEEVASKLGYLEAICNLSRFYCGMHPDSLFENYPFKPCENDTNKGLEYMRMAAEFGDRRSMIYLGDYFKNGPIKDWDEAYKWYEQAVAFVNENDDSGGFDSVNDAPVFEIQARMAEIKHIGGFNVIPDLELACDLYSKAANNATIAGKGRLATKLYILADELLLKIEE